MKKNNRLSGDVQLQTRLKECRSRNLYNISKINNKNNPSNNNVKRNPSSMLYGSSKTNHKSSLGNNMINSGVESSSDKLKQSGKEGEDLVNKGVGFLFKATKFISQKALFLIISIIFSFSSVLIFVAIIAAIVTSLGIVG